MQFRCVFIEKGAVNGSSMALGRGGSRARLGAGACGPLWPVRRRLFGTRREAAGWQQTGRAASGRDPQWDERKRSLRVPCRRHRLEAIRSAPRNGREKALRGARGFTCPASSSPGRSSDPGASDRNLRELPQASTAHRWLLFLRTASAALFWQELEQGFGIGLQMRVNPC